MNKRHYEHTLPNIRGSLSNTYEETDKRPDKEKETASENPEPHPKRKSESGFRQKYLVNTPMPGRIQVYLNRKLYDEIKNYLNVIAPEVSLSLIHI